MPSVSNPPALSCAISRHPILDDRQHVARRDAGERVVIVPIRFSIGMKLIEATMKSRAGKSARKK